MEKNALLVKTNISTCERIESSETESIYSGKNLGALYKGRCSVRKGSSEINYLWKYRKISREMMRSDLSHEKSNVLCVVILLVSCIVRVHEHITGDGSSDFVPQLHQ